MVKPPKTVDDLVEASSKTALDESFRQIKIDTTFTDITASTSGDSYATPRVDNITDITRSASCDSKTTLRVDDIRSIPLQWTPEVDRNQRFKNREEKYLPYDSENNSLCGGDYVINERGEATTISFFFIGREDNKRYGLTVGHFAPRLGHRLYTYCTERTAFIKFIKIGVVKTFAMGVDALIFELDKDIKADFYRVRLTDNIKQCVRLKDCEKAVENLRSKEQLIGRGAIRRGTSGQYTSLVNFNDSNGNVKKGNVGIESNGVDDPYDGYKAISLEGDCGMIMVNGDGEPVSMHCAKGEASILNENGEEEIIYESFSTPLPCILKKFPEYFQVSVEGDYNFRMRTSSQQSPRKAPNLPDSFATLVKPRVVKTTRGAWTGSQRAFFKAVELNPDLLG